MTAGLVLEVQADALNPATRVELRATVASESSDVAQDVAPVIDLAIREADKPSPDPKKLGPALVLVRETVVQEGTKRAIDALLAPLPSLAAWWGSR